MNKSTFKFIIRANIKLFLNLRIADLFTLKLSGKYWKFTTFKRTLHGYEENRIRKYDLGLSERISTLSMYFGLGTEYIIKPDDTVIDIGANIGEFSLACLEKGAKVLSIEPDENISCCTKKNITKFPNSIGLEKSVISNKIGKLKFYRAPSKADSSIIEPENFDDIVSIDAITLDELYLKYDFKRVTLIKCDAEGAEPEVLSHASNALAKTEMVTFNCGPERYGEETVDEVSSILIKNGFDVKVIDGYNPKTIVIGINKNLH